MRISLSWRRGLTVAAVTAGLCGVTAATASATFPHGPFPPGPPAATLFVNNGPTAHPRGEIWWQNQWGSWRGGRWFMRANSSCATAAYTTIGAAVSAAAPGSQIVVCPGVYDEGVSIDKQLTLTGENGAVINAATSPFGNGVQIVGPGGSGSTVQGFKIENAELEGILVGTAPIVPTSTDDAAATSGTPVTDVTIANNSLVDNGTGYSGINNQGFGQCYSTPQAGPGDCGETIHLVSVTNSIVEGNYVADNVGGILLTDEFGPTSGNIIRDNTAIDNTDDCGITLAGHNSAAVSSTTGLPTGLAGVFDNTVENNVANDNGVAGEGAGILLGGGAPFAGVYDNVIAGNEASGNGLAGVTIHQHFAGDLNDNVIEGNVLSNDNLDGDDNFATVDSQTTGILVGSGPTPAPAPPPGPISGTVIRGNVIFNVQVGIWTLNVTPATTTIIGNLFGPGVTTPVSTN
jgi:parallel beta-helix repeat protein